MTLRLGVGRQRCIIIDRPSRILLVTTARVPIAGVGAQIAAVAPAVVAAVPVVVALPFVVVVVVPPAVLAMIGGQGGGSGAQQAERYRRGRGTGQHPLAQASLDRDHLRLLGV